MSKKKRRYTDDGFNLDLTYITDRVIALGFPSEGREAMCKWPSIQKFQEGSIESILRVQNSDRNKMKDVQRFFKSRHRGQFKIYNLCSERTYSAKKFSESQGGGGKAAHYPFEDHNAPTLAQLLDICGWTRSSHVRTRLKCVLMLA